MRITAWLCFSALAVPMAAPAQKPAPIEARVSRILVRMASPNVAARHAGLDDLIELISAGQDLGFDPEYADALTAFLARHPAQADRIKLGLIKLLQADDDAVRDVKAAPGTYSEDDSEHYAQAIDLVASLNDERAIPALVGALPTGGMATDGVLKYAGKALGPVLARLHDPDPLMRSAAVSTAIAVWKQMNDAPSHARIREMIRTSLADPAFTVRSSALWAIDGLDDAAEFVPALQAMAEHDPFTLPSESRYPLRDEAKQLLAKIASR